MIFPSYNLNIKNITLTQNKIIQNHNVVLTELNLA